MLGKHLSDSAKMTLGRKASERWLRRTDQERQQILSKLRQGWRKWTLKTEESRTWIERLVSKWLSEDHILFGEQAPIGFYDVDFLIGNKAIETQGDYWHANPAVYSQWDQLNHMQRMNVRRDRAKATYLKNRGFFLLPLWELDLKKDPAGCREVLRRFLNWHPSEEVSQEF